MNTFGKDIIITPFSHIPWEMTREQKVLHDLWVMSTIYVPVHPYVTEVKLAIASRARDTMKMFDRPDKRSQDRMHEAFFTTYAEWSKKSVNIDTSNFLYQYPTSGSSEAIRESIAYYASEERKKRKLPQIHVFDGEYEWYRAYADTHGVEVITHTRTDYKDSLRLSLQAWQRFYMSAPSGIDGNIWDGYEDFLQYMENYHATSRLMIDLAYLNTTKNILKIRTDSDVIEAIFISMSKSFPGTYYDRIGGVFSKSEIPWLWGNKWFKNLSWLFLWKTLMENSPLGEIPLYMANLQAQAIGRLSWILWNSLTPSDVTFIATKPIPNCPTDIENTLIRSGILRYCLTPTFEILMDNAN